jgi:hypothetical protein
MDETDERIIDAAKSWVKRRLSPGTSTFVHGGGNDSDSRSYHDPHERSTQRLEEFESIYERGGPVASLIDTRALMAFGTGAEFTSDEDERYQAARDGEVQTVSEWLNAQFDNLDNLLVDIGKDAYIYGDSLGEIVETRAGQFSHVCLVNPKTMKPFWDDHGRIHRWVQEITKPDGDEITRPFHADEIPHFKLKSVGRSPLGISLIEQNYDEIKRFARNQEAIENAMRLHGFPKYHIKVGREGAGQVPDGDLRRVRARFRNFNEKTNWTTGRDIEIDTVDTTKTEFEGLAEHDLMILAAGFGVPEEMAGLGRGSTEATAKVRLQSFERNARAEQRKLADQFIEQIVRPVLDRYSPFPRDVDVSLEFGDVVSDQTATAEWLSIFKEYYTPDEVREKMGDGPAPEDEELGPPGGAEQGGMGGGFTSFGTAPGGPETGGTDGEATPSEAVTDREREVDARLSAPPDERRDRRKNEEVPEWVKRGEVRRDGGW